MSNAKPSSANRRFACSESVKWRWSGRFIPVTVVIRSGHQPTRIQTLSAGSDDESPDPPLDRTLPIPLGDSVGCSLGRFLESWGCLCLDFVSKWGALTVCDSGNHGILCGADRFE